MWSFFVFKQKTAYEMRISDWSSDVCSSDLLDLALQAGVSPDRISFAGPGKRNEELEAAISVGVTVNLESEGEADRALALTEKLGKTPRLAVRVNPDFDLRGSGMRMGGGDRKSVV